MSQCASHYLTLAHAVGVNIDDSDSLRLSSMLLTVINNVLLRVTAMPAMWTTRMPTDGN